MAARKKKPRYSRYKKPLNLHLKKGALHRQMHIGAGKKIPVGKLRKLSHSKNVTTKRRAVFALNARKWHHVGRRSFH